MQLTVCGNDVFVAGGGRAFNQACPALVFLHGAGSDHSVWALLARAFAHRGWCVLAPDLPGHGRSGGPALSSIAALADWTAALIDAAGVGTARLVGHSMGSLVALETAARYPEKVTALGLLATAAPMRVADDLLAAAKANDHAAIDIIVFWAHGVRTTLGGCEVPGLWMAGGSERLLERAAPGVLFADLHACNDYRNAFAAAARVKAPAQVILGSRDLMTPVRSGKAVADAIAGCRLAVLDGAGHMLMSERPAAVLAALREKA